MTEGDRTIATCNQENGTGDHQLIFACGTSYGSTQFKFVNLDTMEYDSIQVTYRSSTPIEIPACDYLLFRYDWTGTGGTDLDIATEFTNTGLDNVDNRPLGYGLYGTFNGSTNSYPYNSNYETGGNAANGAQITDLSGNPILVWGGDNTLTDQRESVYINVKNLCSSANYETLPLLINISLYAVWWNKESDTPIKIEMTAYKGGTMERDNSKNFSNLEKNVVYTNASNPPTRKISGPTIRDYQSYRTKFIKVGCVTFNKADRTASIEIYSDAPTPIVTRTTNVDIPPQLKGESKDDYSLRIRKYYNNKK